VIDSRRIRFLDWWDFGVPGKDGWWISRTPTLFLAWVTAAGLGGCSSRPARPPVEDSLTSGRITIVCPAEAESLLARERDAFQSLYPDASIRIEPGRSREAVQRLFSGECDASVLSRDLSPEERGAASRGGLELEGYRFAKDAVAVIVHPDNPTENVALEVLKGIYQGEITDWSQAAGFSGRIIPVIPPVESDMTDFFIEHVMDGQPIRAKALTARSDSDVVREVAGRSGAIGFVSLAWVGRGAKTLRMSAMNGLPYEPPDPETVYRGEYPLSRPYLFEVRAAGPRLAHGFITYVTSQDGQRIVHEAGLVPTAVPVRFVRRSPMKGAH
jgi:phosphate transport system substrate-binding protein